MLQKWEDKSLIFTTRMGRNIHSINITGYLRKDVEAAKLPRERYALVYWPIETMRAEFEANHADPQRVVADLLGDNGIDEEEFWDWAKTNLQAGKVRLVFVADEIPLELRRVVEFLNQQMNAAEVLAVEVK